MGPDPGSLVVRRAGPGDAAAVGELLEHLSRFQRDWRVFPPRAGFTEEIAARLLASDGAEDAIHLVAEAGGQVVGTAYGEEHVVSRFSDARSLEVSSFVVRDGWRGRGVGRALMLELVRFARSRAVGYLDLATFADNAGAARFWERAGMRPRFVQYVGEVDVIEGELRSALE